MKKYNLFIFFTTFARVLIEVFVPIILYKQGYDIRNILLFLIIVSVLNLIMLPIVNYIGQKIGFKIVVFLSAFFFVSMYYFLIEKNNLFVVTLLYSMNTICYYLGKHNYAVNVIDSKVGTKVGSFIIVAILATIPASYIGAFLINKLNIYQLIIIVLVIYIIGILPLSKIKHKKSHLLSVIKKIPKRNLFFFITTQFKTIFFFLFPLFIFINIKREFEYIGIINFITGIASIIFIYFYSKNIDKKRLDYMFLASSALSLIVFVEVQYATSYILLFTSFFEGVATKMYEVSITRDLYYIDNKLDNSSYFLVFELINNMSKLVVISVIYFLNISLHNILMILIMGIFISGFVKYQIPKEKST